MKKVLSHVVIGATVLIILTIALAGCGLPTTQATDGTKQDTATQIITAAELQQRQPTPADIEYSLERYNLVRRAYWVNGQREKARTLPCPIADVPLGYIVLLTDSGAVVGKFTVEGKVTSLNSFLTPDSEYYEAGHQASGGNGGTNADNNKWLADVDGSYGANDNGIFFFTPDGKYCEWSGKYLYSDIPFEVESPVVKVVEQ